MNLSSVESDVHLANAERKEGRAMEQLSAIGGGWAVSDNVVLADSLGYQSINAKAAKVCPEGRHSS